MPDNTPDMDDDDMVAPKDQSRNGEHERVRSANDRDQELEREDIESEHVRGEGRSEDIDPDSAESDVDRDDFLTD